MPAEIIVALDFSEAAQCIEFVDHLTPTQCALKIGSELFTSQGPDIVRRCQDKGFRVFLDLKFHDIPTTVAKAVQAAAELGVWMLTLHAAGGVEMLSAARAVCQDRGPLLIAVTVLTSQTELMLKTIGVDRPLIAQSHALAQLAHQAKMDGVVCAGFEVPMVKQAFGEHFLAVTPGIRLLGDATHDQQRVMTPQEAASHGSDYLVMGRSLTQAVNPRQVLETVYQELHGA